MATRIILNEAKSPLQFLLRNPSFFSASKTTSSLSQAIQNLWVSDQKLQADSGFLSKPVFSSGVFASGVGLNDGQLKKDLCSALNDLYRVETRGTRRVVDEEEDDEDDNDFDSEDIDSEFEDGDFDDMGSHDDDEDEDDDDGEERKELRK